MTRIHLRKAAFGAAVAVALGFGAHAAQAAPASDRAAGNCNKWKESSAAGCTVTCERIGEYYYYWNPTTEYCCCTPVPL